MLNTLNTMDRSFRQGRILTILCLVGMIGVSLFSVVYVSRSARQQSEVVYALMGDQAVTLRAVSVLENRPVEARSHVDLFHRSFFDLDPDREVIDRNIARALSLGDQSVRTLYQDYEEDHFYRKLIASNTSQDITVDSIRITMSEYPYHFRCSGQLTITRPSSIVTRSLITEGYFRDVQRSASNPHGFLIERFRVVENNDLRVTKRFE
jgi:conjugative transposon TraK protein